MKYEVFTNSKTNKNKLSKKIITLFIVIVSLNVFGQSPSIGIPDSVKNVSFPGSTGAYNISSSNPLNHTGSSFSNPPIATSCVMNCKSDYLYFYDLNLNVPAGATITGVKVYHTRGGCNAGASVIDTLHLAYNGAIVSTAKRDSTGNVITDTLGSSSDLWGAALTPAMVNSNSFGVFINSTGTGICTFMQSNIQVNVYYTICSASNFSGIPDSVMNVPFPGSTGQYSITNPLTHSGTAFTNPPITSTCVFNCKTDYLYFYDLNINVPVSSTITGVEVIHGRGGCNSGSYMTDTLQLAYNGATISGVKSDVANPNGLDTLGSSSDSWGAALTPAIVNANSFGIFLHGTGTGICTFGQFNIVVNVYYCTTTGIGTTSSTITNSSRIFPNPVSEFLQLEIDSKNIGNSYSIFDYTGKLIQTGKAESELNQINTSAFSSGMYFIRINGENPQTIKFIKK